MMKKKCQMAVLGAALTFSSWAVAQENVGNKLITIAENTPYLDETLVQENVLKECTALGTTFSDSLAEQLTASGFEVQKSARLDITKGDVVQAQLVTMTSGGSIMFGKQMGGSVKVTIYHDGKVTGAKSLTRTSGGGMFGVYRGACSILGKVSNVLGQDVAKWVIEQK